MNLRKLHALLVLGAFGLGLAACGDSGDCPGSVGGSSLDGSYCAFDDLSFDTVRVTYFDSFNALDIRYIRYGNGGLSDFSTQLSVLISGKDQPLDFGPGEIAGQYLTVQALRDGATRLSQLDIDEDRSNVVLERYDGVGEVARGEVNLLINLRNASGGRAVTLDGSFEGTVIDFDAQFGD